MTFKRPFQTIFGSFVAQKENVVLPKTKAEVRDDSIPPSPFLAKFYIQLVFKAPLFITLMISDQKIVSGSLFFQLFQKKTL